MNLLSLIRIAAVVGSMALAACQSAAPRVEAAADPALAHYRPTLPGDGTAYTLDAAASKVTIYAFRGGAAARFGHNHVLSTPQLEGAVRVGDALGSATFSLRFRLDQLQVDDPALRRQTGASFSGERSAADIDGTLRNLLKGFDAAQYPDVVINSLAVGGDWPVAVARVAITLHGVTREQTLPLRVERDDGALRVRGSLALRQTDHGVQPFAILGGTLSVQDEIAVEFELRARPVGGARQQE